jgi:L-ascorbate metabolism protein UlaG (beta-lactamase superfamily)
MKVIASIGILVFLLAASAVFYTRLPKFGTLPEGIHLERVKKSPHYQAGEFKNLVPTPQFAEGSSFASNTFKFLFTPKDRPSPSMSLPTVKTEINNLSLDQDLVIWLGHSSYYMQMGGKRILIDPVISSYAAPVSFLNQAFAGTTIYKAEDFPEIDYLLISHDHWDHLDYPTMVALKSKIHYVICPLGVASDFKGWGFEKERIFEKDWYERVDVDNGFFIEVLPARHFSGRLLNRNQTLWAGFALVTPQQKVFFSGDSGYSDHFKEIGERFGGFDWVFLENGQYDPAWPYIHMNPEESAQAAEDLQAKFFMPGHMGRFSISNHSWDDPFWRVSEASKNKTYQLQIPMIGELVNLSKPSPENNQWWKDIQ